MSAKWLFTFKHFKFPLLPLLTHSAVQLEILGSINNATIKTTSARALKDHIVSTQTQDKGAQVQPVWLFPNYFKPYEDSQKYVLQRNNFHSTSVLCDIKNTCQAKAYEHHGRPTWTSPLDWQSLSC